MGSIAPEQRGGWSEALLISAAGAGAWWLYAGVHLIMKVIWSDIFLKCADIVLTGYQKKYKLNFFIFFLNSFLPEKHNSYTHVYLRVELADDVHVRVVRGLPIADDAWWNTQLRGYFSITANSGNSGEEMLLFVPTEKIL